MGKVGFHVRLEPELHETIKEHASRDGLSMNEYIVRGLEHVVNNDADYVRLVFTEDEDGNIQLDFELPEKIVEKINGLQGSARVAYRTRKGIPGADSQEARARSGIEAIVDSEYRSRIRR